PVASERRFVGAFALCDFALVVREDVIDAAAVNVEGRSQIFERHRRAFDVPAGEAFTPRAIPAQDVFGIGFFPQRKVFRITLFATHGFARPRFLLLNTAVGEFAVIWVFAHVEIYAAVGDVGIA